MKSKNFWAQKAVRETGELMTNVTYFETWAEQIQINTLEHALELARNAGQGQVLAYETIAAALTSLKQDATR